MIRRENQCGGKICYISAEKANASVANINHGCKKKRMSSYKCGDCGKWHVGHNNKRTMKHHDKVPISYMHIPGIHKLDNDE